MKIIIYIVTGRCGVEMDSPAVFPSKEEAMRYITDSVAERVWDDHSDELEDDGISYEDRERIVEWGTGKDYCDESTYKCSDDWSEFMITEEVIDTDEFLHEGDKKYWDAEYFSIEQVGKDKEIHFFGYFYDEGQKGCDKEGEENPDYTSRCVEYSGLVYGLQEFIDIRDGQGKEIRNWITEKAAGVNQYVGDMTPTQAIRSMNEYFDGHAPAELRLEDITMDTPAGDYVDYKED